MSATTFGKRAVNDGKLVPRLREGCNMTLATIDRARKFIKGQRQATEANTAPEAKPSTSRRKWRLGWPV